MLTPGTDDDNQFRVDAATIDATSADGYIAGRLPEVYSTSTIHFLPGTVRTQNTPPLPAGTTGTRVVEVDNVRAPAPMDTDTPSPKV